jgi:hypothetical protein
MMAILPYKETGVALANLGEIQKFKVAAYFTAS